MHYETHGVCAAYDGSSATGCTILHVSTGGAVHDRIAMSQTHQAASRPLVNPVTAYMCQTAFKGARSGLILMSPGSEESGAKSVLLLGAEPREVWRIGCTH